MQVNKIQPIVADTHKGRVWLFEGFRIFKKQPLIWILALLAYWTAMFLFGLIPIVGLIASLILSPGIAFGFICLAKAVDENQIAPPRIIISGFTGPKKLDLILLGFYYCAFLFLLLILITIINEKSIADLINKTDATIEGETPKEKLFNLKVIAVLIFYIPIQMLFWFAPQLIVWGNLSSMKAMFYSFFAVLLNWKSFATYLITWIMILISTSIAIALIISIFKLDQGILFVLFLPISLLVMGVAHCSYYESTKTIFSDLIANKSDTNQD